MDYTAIDSILDDFQKIFKEMKVSHSSPHATIERWRWDLPQISFMWLAEDAIWRNINVLVDTTQGIAEPIIERVEVNAWQDVQKDNRWIRRWWNEVLYESISYEKFRSWEYDNTFTKCFKTVTTWTLEDLKAQQPLSQREIWPDIRKRSLL
jgi:hypothetical protein